MFAINFKCESIFSWFKVAMPPSSDPTPHLELWGEGHVPPPHATLLRAPRPPARYAPAP